MSSGEFSSMTKIQNCAAVLHFFNLFVFIKVFKYGILSIFLSFFIIELINLYLGLQSLQVKLYNNFNLVLIFDLLIMQSNTF
jgi:hypothetical protein